MAAQQSVCLSSSNVSHQGGCPLRPRAGPASRKRGLRRHTERTCHPGKWRGEGAEPAPASHPPGAAGGLRAGQAADPGPCLAECAASLPPGPSSRFSWEELAREGSEAACSSVLSARDPRRAVCLLTSSVQMDRYRPHRELCSGFNVKKSVNIITDKSISPLFVAQTFLSIND